MFSSHSQPRPHSSHSTNILELEAIRLCASVIRHLGHLLLQHHQLAVAAAYTLHTTHKHIHPAKYSFKCVLNDLQFVSYIFIYNIANPTYCMRVEEFSIANVMQSNIWFRIEIVWSDIKQEINWYCFLSSSSSSMVSYVCTMYVVLCIRSTLRR